MLTTSFPRFPGDAAGHFIFELAATLAKTHNVTVVAPGTAGVSAFEVVKNLRIIRFHYFFPRKYEKLAYGDGIIDNLRNNPSCALLVPFFALGFLLKSLKYGKRCDLIHAHWVLSGLIALLGKWFHRKPVILTVRGSDVNANVLGNRTSKLFLRWVFKRCDYVTTVSQDLSEKIINRFGVDERIAVVPNGVSLDSFHPTDQSVARKTLAFSNRLPVVLYAGRLTEAKGVGDLLEVIPRVLKSHKNVLFVFLGDGNLAEKISQFCEDMEVKESVLLVGSKRRDELPIWLNAADLVVLPSLSEGRPNIVLEAMACGVPIVATRVGGIPELIINGENGILVPPNDVEALTQAILAVLKMNYPQETLGKRARETLESLKVDWESSAEKMAGVYEKVLVGR